MKPSSYRGRREAPRPTVRVPNFESGLISEPLLAFGGQQRHVDPKTGLALYGPYSLVGQTVPMLKNIIVGIVGPPAMIAAAFPLSAFPGYQYPGSISVRAKFW